MQNFFTSLSIRYLLKQLKKEIFSLNFIFSLIVGQFFSFYCIIKSIKVLGDKKMQLSEVDVWGNTVYPRSVVNSCMCLYSEQDILIIYLIIIFSLFMLRVTNTFEDRKYPFDTNDVRIETLIRSMTKFLTGTITTAITLFLNLVVTSCFIPFCEPYGATWEFATFDSDFLYDIYCNYFFVYVLSFQILICIVSGLVVQTTLFWDYITYHKKIINVSGKILFVIVINVNAFFAEKTNLFIYIDPGNFYGKQKNILLVIIILFLINVIENVYMYNNKKYMMLQT